MRRVVAAALIMALAACTSPVGREGPVPPAGKALDDASFVLASAPIAGDSVASEMVSLMRRALVAKGYREAPDGRYRLEVGLAVAPLQVAVRGDGDGPISREEARNPVVLCRPRRYVLTTGMIDRTDGKLLFRNMTAARHCGTSLDKLLPRMVEAAISSQASPPGGRGS